MYSFFYLIAGHFGSIGKFFVTLLLTALLAYLVQRIFNRFIRHSTLILRNDPTRYKFLNHAITAIIYTVGLSMAIDEIHVLKKLADSLLAGAGILAVAVGFASQNALSNIVSGIFIVIFRPFRVNDRLKIQDKYSGVVEDITLRHTIIRDAENKRIIIPNTVVNSEIIVNADFYDENICRFVEVNISYQTNIDLVKNIMREEISKHPRFVDHRKPEQVKAGVEAVEVKVIKLTDNAVTLRAYAWAKDNVEAFELYCDVLELLKKRFDNEGVKMPSPQYVLPQ